MAGENLTPEGNLLAIRNNTAGMPAALGANGGLKVEGVAGGVAQPVSGPQTNAEFLASNRCTITKTSVDSVAVSTTLIAANANRKSLAIVNTDANILYVDLSGGTATNACVPVAAGGHYAPTGAVPTNAITGIWAADGAGAATIFEGA